MKEKEILVEENKKPYQKPELVIHGSVDNITEQFFVNPGSVNVGASVQV